jgi:hypothetical protein
LACSSCHQRNLISSLIVENGKAAVAQKRDVSRAVVVEVRRDNRRRTPKVPSLILAPRLDRLP